MFHVLESDAWPDKDELEALNADPVTYLATLGIRAGAPHPNSVRAAEALMRAHGQQRPITAHEAIRFREHMTEWSAWTR